MGLTLANKKLVVDEIAAIAREAVSIVAAKYRGLDANQMSKLRDEARKQGVVLRVIRNTLSRRALQNTEHECLCDSLVGPLVLAFSADSPSAAARLVKDAVKANDKLEAHALSLGGQLYAAKDLDVVASLPTRDEALSKLLAVMKEPVAKFVRVLAAPHTKLVRTVAAIRHTKQ